MASPDRPSVVQIQFDRDEAGFTGRIRVNDEPERTFSGRLELMRDLELAYAASGKEQTPVGAATPKQPKPRRSSSGLGKSPGPGSNRRRRVLFERREGRNERPTDYEAVAAGPAILAGLLLVRGRLGRIEGAMLVLLYACENVATAILIAT